MENLILMSHDGTLPVVDNHIIMGGRIRKHHFTGGNALPKMMSNLQLFDTSVMRMKGKGVALASGSIKPNFVRKPIKFII